MWYPRQVTLPMGWAAAVGVAQMAHVHSLRLDAPMVCHAFALYGKLVPTLVGELDRCAGVYIDDFVGLTAVNAACCWLGASPDFCTDVR